MRNRRLKGLLYINGVPHTYEVEGCIEPIGFTYQPRIKYQTLIVRIANESDLNSPGFEEVNDVVLDFITNQARQRYARNTSANTSTHR